jgi:predicted GIY-YIG superfamily endonuclease
MKRRHDVPGIVYLLHFTERYRRAGHYLGYTEDDLEARMHLHESGAGANLVRVIVEAGIDFELARTWNGTRARERAVKAQGGASRLCPLCKGRRPRIDHRTPGAARV